MTVKTIRSSDIVKAARELIGTPYKHQGRTPGKELDCVGVIIATGKLSGALPLEFDYLGYSRDADGSLLREFDNYGLSLPDLTAGAIALFKIDAVPHHCGIITPRFKGDDWGVVHAYQSAKKVKEHNLICWWKTKIVRLYGFPGVDYGSS